jgi:hypothetical protein
VKFLPSEQLDMIIGWRSRMFSEGHSMEEIDNLSYWDLQDYADFLRDTQPKQQGHTYSIKPAQQRMIDEHKKKHPVGKKK